MMQFMYKKIGMIIAVILKMPQLCKIKAINQNDYKPLIKKK